MVSFWLTSCCFFCLYIWMRKEGKKHCHALNKPEALDSQRSILIKSRRSNTTVQFSWFIKFCSFQHVSKKTISKLAIRQEQRSTGGIRQRMYSFITHLVSTSSRPQVVRPIVDIIWYTMRSVSPGTRWQLCLNGIFEVRAHTHTRTDSHLRAHSHDTTTPFIAIPTRLGEYQNAQSFSDSNQGNGGVFMPPETIAVCSADIVRALLYAIGRTTFATHKQVSTAKFVCKLYYSSSKALSLACIPTSANRINWRTFYSHLKIYADTNVNFAVT